MKRIFLLSVLCVCIIALYGEEYTIVFNSSNSDSSTPATGLSGIVLSSTCNCVQEIRTANKIYRAKEGFGIKGGTGSAKGELTLGLDAHYHMSSLTVYAASYVNKKDSAQGIIVCGDTIRWQEHSRTTLCPYTVKLSGDALDSIHLSSIVTSNNRWYVQKIVFSAPDPFPEWAKFTHPAAIDLGTAILVDGAPETDVTTIAIEGYSVASSQIDLSLKYGKVYALNTSSLPPEGGSLDIVYNVSAQGKYPDSLFVEAFGSNRVKVRHAIPLSLSSLNYTPPVLEVDSSCMHIGAMPKNYYAPAQGLQDSLLKSALGEIVNCGVRYRYGSGKNHTWHGFFFTDRDTTTHQVLDMYSYKQRYFNPLDTFAGVKELDIEHMFPKSWWGGDVNRAYCDLFHLVPADYSANRSKSNHAPGIPADSTFNNGSFVTGSGKNYGLPRVFCPADEYKGDFARAYFYLVTCYGDELHWLNTGEAKVAMNDSSYLEFRPWLQELLLSWHRQDPVSEKEKARAVEVNKIQGNRNPFIDYPELVEYIWGNKQGVQVNFHHLTQSFGDPYDETTALPSLTPDRQDILKVEHHGQILIRHNHQEHTLIGQPYR